MDPDPLAEIRRALTVALAGGEDHGVTFEVAGDPDAWVQFTGHNLNLAYRGDSEPSVDALPRSSVAALGGAELVQWEPKTFVTYEIARPAVDPLADLIDAIFTGPFGYAPGTYRLDVRHERF